MVTEYVHVVPAVDFAVDRTAARDESIVLWLRVRKLKFQQS